MPAGGWLLPIRAPSSGSLAASPIGVVPLGQPQDAARGSRLGADFTPGTLLGRTQQREPGSADDREMKTFDFSLEGVRYAAVVGEPYSFQCVDCVTSGLAAHHGRAWDVALFRNVLYAGGPITSSPRYLYRVMTCVDIPGCQSSGRWWRWSETGWNRCIPGDSIESVDSIQRLRLLILAADWSASS